MCLLDGTEHVREFIAIQDVICVTLEEAIPRLRYAHRETHLKKFNQ